MHWGTTAWLQLLVMVAILGTLHIPLGNYMAHVYTSENHWRVERFIYRMAGVNPDREQNWIWYLFSVLAFSAVSVLGLLGLLIAQTHLPQPWGHKGMTPLARFQHSGQLRHQHQLAETTRESPRWATSAWRRGWASRPSPARP